MTIVAPLRLVVHQPTTRILLDSFLFVFISTTVFLTGTFAVAAQTFDEKAAFFETRIEPILSKHCFQCHSATAKKLKGGLRLDHSEGVQRGGDIGPAVVPGAPDRSLLVKAVRHTDPDLQMPPKGKLSKREIADIEKWVKDGANFPTGKRKPAVAPRTKKLDWWSLKPLIKTSVPRLTATDAKWARTPVDSFIVAAMRKQKLSPSRESDRRTLLRRLYFDLIGLPPTPKQLNAFINDREPNAYERVVDQLLASPRYGERWARHWMDAVHFAETHGHDQDRIRENAWRYRDYLIRSFNRDTPYARFIREQLAADHFYPDQSDLIPALGFAAAGPWDESSLRDIREDSIDRKIGYYLDRDDMVSAVMSTFVSSTVHCARCHDHKFDPISQNDYYSLQAVFAGVGRANVEFDSDPNLGKHRLKITTLLTALDKPGEASNRMLLSEKIQQRVSEWESSVAKGAVKWTVLTADSVTSEHGATLKSMPDHSFVSGGKAPERDTYTFTATIKEERITAIRLELLTDKALPHNGPGRQDNGNLHLSEFKVFATPLTKAFAPDQTPLEIADASADFDQAGWTIKHAIDGDEKTAWGIYPEVGKPHKAIFKLKKPVSFKDGGKLTFTLAQQHGGRHLIGRFRISVTTASGPVHINQLPSTIIAALTTPPKKRNDSQRRLLATYMLRTDLQKQLDKLPPRPQVYVIASNFKPDGSHKPLAAPRVVHVLHRGDIRRPGEIAIPGSLGSIQSLPSRFNLAANKHESERRAALADWIASEKNPLTWRSVVNRVWHHHFGRGIVATPNDFGRMGAQPTHPQLLDWLASEFLAQGGSIKNLHRLIVTSSVYRQASDDRSLPAKVDTDNKYLWRMNRRRLDAESVRDAVLQISGRLDLTMGGPSVRQFSTKAGVHVTPVVEYQPFDWNSPGAGRRSVYRFVFRTLPDPFMDSLDCADASQLTPKRNVSVTPLQALAMLNNEFMLFHSARFAGRLKREAPDLSGRITRAFELVLNRKPTADESIMWATYAKKHGVENFCRMLLNTNEFMFVD